MGLRLSPRLMKISVTVALKWRKNLSVLQILFAQFDVLFGACELRHLGRQTGFDAEHLVLDIFKFFSGELRYLPVTTGPIRVAHSRAEPETLLLPL